MRPLRTCRARRSGVNTGLSVASRIRASPASTRRSGSTRRLSLDFGCIIRARSFSISASQVKSLVGSRNWPPGAICRWSGPVSPSSRGSKLRFEGRDNVRR